MKNVLKGFTRAEALQVLERGGFRRPSPRQLHYWAYIGLIEPFMLNAKTPVYRFVDLVTLALVGRLMADGLAIQSAQKIMGHLGREGLKRGHVEFLLTTGGLHEVRTKEDITTLLKREALWRWAEVAPEETVDAIYAAAEAVIGLNRMPWDELATFGIVPIGATP